MEAGFTLHGHLYDCCTNKCLVVANVAGVKLNHTVVDAAGAKKPEFLKKSPAGTLPVLETKEGSIFGAVAVCRFLSRQNGAKLCGGNDFAHAQVDQWIDFNTTQIAPAVCELTGAIYGHKCTTSECTKWANDELRKSLKVVDEHLKTHKFLVGETQTLADLLLASTLIDVYRLLFNKKNRDHFGNVSKWFDELVKQEAFKSVHGTIHLCDKEWHACKEDESKEGKKEKKDDKKEEKKTEKKAEPKKEDKPKKEAGDDEDEPKEKAPKNPLDALPPSTFDLYNFKTLFVNAENKKDAMKVFWETFDNNGYSIWFVKYQKAEGEGVKTFLTVNLSEGFLQKVESLRKYAFAVHGVYGAEPNLEIRGCWVWRGTDHPQDLKEQGSYEYHTFVRADPTKESDRKLVEEYWCNLKEGDQVDGMQVKDVSYFK